MIETIGKTKSYLFEAKSVMQEAVVWVVWVSMGI